MVANDAIYNTWLDNGIIADCTNWRDWRPPPSQPIHVTVGDHCFGRFLDTTQSSGSFMDAVCRPFQTMRCLYIGNFAGSRRWLHTHEPNLVIATKRRSGPVWPIYVIDIRLEINLVSQVNKEIAGCFVVIVVAVDCITWTHLIFVRKTCTRIL
jgi:hypothetical protein